LSEGSTKRSTPPAIGGTTPAAGSFTNLSTSAASTFNANTFFNGGTNTFTGDLFAGSGNPWVDVKSGANGCAAAAGNASNDDTSAIQCQINFMNSTFSGGVVFVPPGNYKITSTLTMKGLVHLHGAGGRGISFISTAGADLTAIQFDSTAAGAAMEWITVSCMQNVSATRNCVTIANNDVVYILNSQIFGGAYALSNNGVDGTVFNSQIAGWGSGACGIISQGANWYVRVKIDQSAVSTACAFQHTTSFTGASSAEEHFFQCDFSGNYTDGILIQDTGGNAIIVVSDSVLSSPVSVTGGRYIIFNGDEFAGNIATSVNMSIAASFGIAAVTVSGAGTRSCAANSNITC
jgi:hypothetical protein